MKKNYLRPEAELISFYAEEVITTNPDDEGNFGEKSSEIAE